MDKDYENREVFFSVNRFPNEKKRKLHYVIHNPNTVEETAKVLLEILIQANAGKVERGLQQSLKSLGLTESNIPRGNTMESYSRERSV